MGSGEPGTNRKAIAAAICSVIGLLGAIPAVVLGILALREITATPGQGGRTLAVIGVVLGGLQILIVTVIVLPMLFKLAASNPEPTSTASNSLRGTSPTHDRWVAEGRRAIRNIEKFEANAERCAAQGNCTVDAIAGDIQLMGAQNASGAAVLPLIGVTAEVTDSGRGFRISAVAKPVRAGQQEVRFTSTGTSGHACAPIDKQLCPAGTW